MISKDNLTRACVISFRAFGVQRMAFLQFKGNMFPRMAGNGRHKALRVETGEALVSRVPTIGRSSRFSPLFSLLLGGCPISHTNFIHNFILQLFIIRMEEEEKEGTEEERGAHRGLRGGLM
ncbi:hypothetical protein MN608_02201 [Microdochium nivale]|nr:hypothetical protein MN608_02201 [Microdochium nivale]